MTDVREAFEKAGCADVRTVIQSGNVVFEASDPADPFFENVRSRLRDLLNAEPTIVFRELNEIKRLVRRDPFEDRSSDSAVKLYVAFLSRKPVRRPRFPVRSRQEALEAIGMQSLEVFIVSRPKKSGFYGLPNNFIEEQLGVPATSRNWSTVKRIADIEIA